MSAAEYVLMISCLDRKGLVYEVTSWLFGQDCNVIDSDQFGDPKSGLFFMRVHFAGGISLDALLASFEPVGAENSMSWEIWPLSRLPKVLIMVSRQDHCLVDLLYRTRNGELPIDIPLIVSNHRDAYRQAAEADIDFLHLPVTPETRADQERRLMEEVRSRQVDFIVLARYMQILSADFCGAFEGRIINIHHSFLPSFKGARPYHQAHERGVKLIGATAHYVTATLDEGRSSSRAWSGWTTERRRLSWRRWAGTSSGWCSPRPYATRPSTGSC